MTDKKLMKRLGEALRNLRMERGLTEEEVALAMGKNRSSGRTISIWELGRSAPGADQLFAYLLAIDMTFADLDRQLNPTPFANPRLQAIAERLRAF